MKYYRSGNTLVVRMDKGEEITEQLKRLAREEKILLAEVNGLGAIDDFTVGVYDVADKVFRPRTFQGCYEIVSLHGTINTFHGAYYSHLHMSAGNAEGQVLGGHLSRAVISATGELVVTILDGTVDRRYDEETGLNLFDL